MWDATLHELQAPYRHQEDLRRAAQTRLVREARAVRGVPAGAAAYAAATAAPRLYLHKGRGALGHAGAAARHALAWLAALGFGRPPLAAALPGRGR